MLLAQLDVHHSRPIAPTRRVAIGDRLLPVDPAPGYGGLLLGGVVARFVPDLDADTLDGLDGLIGDLERGASIAQPRLRHRLQEDRVGLLRSRHRLVSLDGMIEYRLDEGRAAPVQHALVAVYAAGQVPSAVRADVLGVVRRALGWFGPIDGRLIAHLSGHRGLGDGRAMADPLAWARDVLDIDDDPDCIGPDVVQRRFRLMLRDAHPDHGGVVDQAADRIADLREARRILLAARSS